MVTRRNVNPGNNVQVGQSLMAMRSLREIWVDANFKETQLRDLRIGQRVELEVDMYGGKQTFEGRISGFTMGTGSTLALLPAQNATGNFRQSRAAPAGADRPGELRSQTSCRSSSASRLSRSVDIKSTPTGPNAGKISPGINSPAPSASPVAAGR